MNQITTEIKTHAVITYDDVHYLITAPQFEKLANALPDAKWVIEGNLVKQKNIASILTMEKYYETYPQRRPADYAYSWDEIKHEAAKGFSGIITSVKRVNGLIHMGIGLRRVVEKYRGQGVEPQNALFLLSQMETKLAALEAK